MTLFSIKLNHKKGPQLTNRNNSEIANISLNHEEKIEEFFKSFFNLIEYSS